MTLRAIACAITIAAFAAPAHAQIADAQLKEMLKAAEGLGQGQAIGESCGVDLGAMTTAITRGWKCQGASADQIAKLQAAAAASRAKHKGEKCPVGREIHAAAIAATTSQLEAGLKKINCGG